ncbi:hypothetical protein Aph01nite_08010 [Acrocarpospora phusangensis]|uniref:Transport permease protein n=1 Tax=Acrocarpospora phusangensis TaxID=1070424 RepID=A0A919Q6I6_9ACTN|nr:ABC transporter permease [Acrocarpospora phusangensis]GIH22491.1 hypothetical protein Aph01nite_08010 [Acrocarpospora phusangensis]
MSPFRSLSRAMLLGFVRDKTSVFFTILFPLMFLVLFGALLTNQGVSKSKIIQVGPVAVLDQSQGLGEILDITRRNDLAAAQEEVRQGDFVAVVRQEGDRYQLFYTAADQVRAGTVRGVFGQLIGQANAAGVPQRFTLEAEQVEDKSLKVIQYVTPGLLSWAISMGATFGAAMTLVTWRQKKTLRRLRLAPVRTTTVVSARVGASVAIALVQTAIFLGVASLPMFGLRLSDYWWMCIPMVIAGTLVFMAIGMVAGGVAKTSEAAAGIANLIVLPMAFLSGTFFPLDAAPAWVRTVSNIFPMKHLNEGMLDVMVRGQGPASILPELGIILGFGLVIGLIAVLLFRWDDV